MAYYGLLLSMMVMLQIVFASRTIQLHCPSKCICHEGTVKCIEKRLSVIPDFKNVNKSLTLLDLSGNDIEEVKTTNLFSSKLISLQYLHLNDNSIIDIEVTAFSALPNLQYLDLSNNLLGDVPSHVIQRNRKLEEINLSGNLFSSKTPQLISTSLKILDLSFSKISVFTENSLRGLPSLRVLYLHANSLKQMDYNMFTDVKLQYVGLSFNCWKCNCETIKLFDHLVKAGLTEIDRPIQCMHPNKWYEDIYNSKGPMHHNKLCKRAKGYPNHEEEGTILKKNSTKVEVVNIKNKSEKESEDVAFYMRYEFIVIGAIALFATLVSTIVVTLVITKHKKPHNRVYEELGYGKIMSNKMPIIKA